MFNFNKNLNAFAEKLSKFHISNQPTVHNFKTAAHKTVKKAKPSTGHLRKNTAKQRGKTVKSRKHTAMEQRRKNSYARTLREHKAAATAKARATRAEKKEEEKAKAKTLVVEGRTRGQAKTLGKNTQMK